MYMTLIDTILNYVYDTMYMTLNSKPPFQITLVIAQNQKAFIYLFWSVNLVWIKCARICFNLQNYNHYNVLMVKNTHILNEIKTDK